MVPIIHDPTLNKITTEKKTQRVELIVEETDPLYSFEDVILTQEILDEVKYIISIEENRDLIYNIWGLKDVFKVSRNVSINLYGPSGTGKTMTAHAIAHYLKKKLIIVNYADIESKYVGETSKNLVALFLRAEATGSILFFDEADALLSKRVTSMNNATDVSVNQTRSVLLQQLDSYKGIVLFTTNFIQNYDTAFYRRITSHIKFAMPNKEMRKKIWEHYLVPKLPLEEIRKSFIDSLAEVENVSGSDIATAVLKATVQAAYRKATYITVADVKKALEDTVVLKNITEANQYTLTSKIVPEEYVREKIGKDRLTNGHSANS